MTKCLLCPNLATAVIQYENGGRVNRAKFCSEHATKMEQISKMQVTRIPLISKEK